MASALKYVITIPSIDIPGHAATDDLILLGSKDERYQTFLKQGGVLGKYLESFQTHFGKKVYPSVIVSTRGEGKVGAEDLAAFRNAIAVSAVVYSRVESYLSNEPRGYYCTDLFDFHPVSVSSDGKDLSIRSAFEIGAWASVDDFRGGTTPAVVYPENVRAEFDDEFTLSLLNLIEQKSTQKSDREFRNRVLRSLEMAYYALRSPFMNLLSKTDFGVATSLWVAALEILAHPEHGDVNRKVVCDLIDSIPWETHRLRESRYGIIEGNGRLKTSKKTTLPVQIYGRLCCNRNMYLHGNVIPEGQYEAIMRKGWGSLCFQVPALYRCVLVHLLRAKGVLPGKEVASEQRSYESAMLKRAGESHE